MRIIYGLFIQIYAMLIRVASNFNPKAKSWIDGRKDWRKSLNAQVKHPGEYYWFHCASLGEFEQGRPLMEELKSKNPQAKIALTFFSPSGYEIRKDYELADVIAYLPLDSKSNARDFLSILQPKLAIFVKYEIWPEFFFGIRDKKIPLVMVSAIFRAKQRFFKPWGAWFRKALNCPDYFFVQDEKSKELLHSIGIDNAKVSGDTRFDRVMKIAENSKPIPLIENFIDGRKAIVLGSSWPSEEDICVNLSHFLDESYCFIIAPHEIDDDHVNAILKKMGDSVILYSRAQSGELKSARTLVIDNMGLLSRIYRYAYFGIIGGGFGKGIHNTVEAAVYGVPLAFGPKHVKLRSFQTLVNIDIF